MIHEETFAPLASTIEKLRRLRLAAPAVAALSALVCIAVVRQLAVERKLLLFDLGIGLVLTAGLYFVARQMIAAEAEHRRRTEMAIVIGVATGGAALGIFAVALMGTPLGIGKLPQLLVIQLLGAVSGAVAGFFLASCATLIVAAVRLVAKRPTPTIDGAGVGGLAGVAGGSLLNHLPHLGLWFTITATIVGAVAGYHAARLHQRRRP